MADPVSVQPKLFDFQGQAVRVVGTVDDPWFVAKDVCSALGIEWKGSGSIGPLDDDEKGVETIYTLGGPQEMSVINESGLYALIFKSRKPQAREFRKWVTAVVLPAIRKTGAYAVKPEPAPAVQPSEVSRLVDCVTKLTEAIAMLLARIETLIPAAPAPAQAPEPRKPGPKRRHTLAALLGTVRMLTRNGAAPQGFNELYREVKSIHFMARETYADLLADGVAAGAILRDENGKYFAR